MRDSVFHSHLKVRYRVLLAAVLLILFVAVLPFGTVTAQAAGEEELQGVPYEVTISDMADLLTEEEEEELYEVMLPGTEFGNMVFITTEDAEDYESKDYIEMLYQTTDSLRGTEAVIYLIDMDNRMLWITGYKKLSGVISPDYGNLITDNVYKYAKSGDYASCALRGYRQIVQRLSGSRVSGPLRGIGNLCIAVIIAEILCFLIAYATSVSRKTDEYEVLDNVERTINIRNQKVKKTGTRKVFDPQSNSSSSGGSRGGGGGGGFSGGGGGHGF